MAKKKTLYVWIMMVIIFILIILDLSSVISRIIYLFSPDMDSFGISQIFSGLLNIGSLVIMSIFLVKLYNVSNDLIKWTNINFGFSTISYVSVLILSIISTIKDPGMYGLGAIGLIFLGPMLILILVIEISLWITFYYHLKNAKIEKSMDFS